jgi:hypothetical protein
VPEAIGALAQKEDASSTRQQLLTWCFGRIDLLINESALARPVSVLVLARGTRPAKLPGTHARVVVFEPPAGRRLYFTILRAHPQTAWSPPC